MTVRADRTVNAKYYVGSFECLYFRIFSNGVLPPRTVVFILWCIVWLFKFFRKSHFFAITAYDFISFSTLYRI